ncbi:MAG: hypothetical protein VX833_07370 [Actinomycetota bacterium]|nr:hypothetical protein [Actinomycetota bacterium]
MDLLNGREIFTSVLSVAPASVVPMAAKIRCFNRRYHKMAKPFRNRLVTARALVGLLCLIGLNNPGCHLAKRFGIFHVAMLPVLTRHPKRAQATTRAVIRIAAATKARSLRWRR